MADFGISEGLMLASGLSSGGGTILSGGAQRQAGAVSNAMYQYKAAQEEQAAGQARAAAQRDMFATQKKADLTQSTLQARAAADGGTATDPTVLTVSQDIAGQGEYNSLADLFRGEDKARGLEAQATADRLSGKYAKQGANLQSMGTLLSGGGSMFEKFGKAWG